MATTKKPKKPPVLDIKRVLSAVDHKNYNFYDNLTEEEKKAFSPYILMRFTSNSSGDPDIQEWFIEKTNEMVNKNYHSLSKNHKELLWKLYAATGVGITVDHQYLPPLKVEFNKIEKLLAELNPSMKISDVKLLASMMDKTDQIELFDLMGFDKKQRKEYE